jgi:fumarate hydratase class II
VNNFGPARYPIPAPLRQALGLIKRAAAEVNGELGHLPPRVAEAVAAAAGEIEEGSWADQFPVDVFQTGSGTSWNMNANEVIARRAAELLSEHRSETADESSGDSSSEEGPVIHPNDTVNRGQSSNDVIPTAILVAARREAEDLLTELRLLCEALDDAQQRAKGVVKTGRTHLQDAVPMTAAQEAGAWRQRISDAIKRLEQVMPVLEQLPLGGTAVGTGLNSSAEFAARTVERLAAATGFPYRESPNRFALIASREECLQLMGALDGAGAALEKIAEDLRLLVSGPRTGLGEYRIPEVQPGSSIMPGKVNPVIPEMVSQTAACVSGKYSAVRSAAVRGPLQLNIMQPLIAYEVLESIALLSRATQRFTVRCITGLMPNAEHCAAYVEQSLALVTSLAPRIGYDLAARVARLAAEENLSVREAARRESGLDEAEIDKLLDAGRMAGEG